eukprot:GFUD01126578.1.p1 GENE.GFUD01126578.1~~GFUD01126578.1.p1  ORF type:complete len:327 (+),score=86.20 GFUD01126578.1:103-981(+)
MADLFEENTIETETQEHTAVDDTKKSTTEIAKVQDDEVKVSMDILANTKEIDTDRKCIFKQEIVEEIEYDDVLTCNHLYNKRCHTSYSTSYKSMQEEECTEKFKKVCFINYKNLVFNETVTICKESLIKDCKMTGSESCKTEYKTECSSKQEAHEVFDDVVECKTKIETKCADETTGYTSRSKCSQWPRKVPFKLCAPEGCKLVPGPEECEEKNVIVEQKVPKEECFLAPHRTCKFVTKLVPKLEQDEQCSDVPQEACSMSKVNRRTLKKPVLKKWCYDLQNEAGAGTHEEN